MTKRQRWIEELTAVGPKRVPEAVRRQCAERIVSQLASAYPRGVRASHAYEINEQFRAAVDNVRFALFDLRSVIEGDPVGAQTYGLFASSFETQVKGLDAYLKRSSAAIHEERTRVPRPRAGRNKGTAAELAKLVAREFRLAFGKPAGHSKQLDVENPFAAMCDVVQRTLAAVGHKVEIGPVARKEGIEQDCLDALREKRGMTPNDVLVMTNARAALMKELESAD